jgi:glutaredoxin
MNRILLSFFRYAGIAILAVTLFYFDHAEAAQVNGKASKRPVAIVFFAAHDCPRCENVKDLVKVLKARYTLKVKDFDVDKDADYSLFKRVEAIHASDKFAVPLILVGESILMGEDEITGKLEKTVRRLARSGGSRFPYLGSAQEKKTSAKATGSSCKSCERGGPPEVTDELSKLRKFIEKLF